MDTVNYILFTNPIARSTTELVKYAGGATISVFSKLGTKSTIPPVPTTCNLPIWKHATANGSFVRLAGLFGATAVALGAYGAHVTYPKGSTDLKNIFETANRYHFLHTIALLGVPLCRFPRLSGTFLVLGMLLFCGTCYYHALTGNTQYRKFTPVGGMCLIAGWLVMIL